MIKRIPISKLKGLTIRSVKRDPNRPSYIVLSLSYGDSTGRRKLMVEVDELFDKDGNRYEIDV